MASKIVVNLDTSKEVFLNSKCKQNDDLILECNIFENGLAKDLNNCSVVIQALKADKTYIIQNTDIIKSNNKFTANLVRDFTRVAGKTEIEIVLTESSKQNTTFSFCLEVVGSVIRGAVESRNTVTILENLQDKIEEAGVVKQETEQLIEKGGAATKGDIQEVNAHLETMTTYVTPEMYGAVGDGIVDDTEAIQNAINTNKKVVFKRNYKFTTIILKNSIESFGILKGDIILNKSNVNVTFNELQGNIMLLSDSELVQHCFIKGNKLINSVSNGVTFKANGTSGVQYNTVEIGLINSINHSCIYLEKVQGWVNNNYIKNTGFTGKCGIGSLAQSDKYDGMTFDNVGFEHIEKWFELNNCYNFIFKNFRMMPYESHNENIEGVLINSNAFFETSITGLYFENIRCTNSRFECSMAMSSDGQRIADKMSVINNKIVSCSRDSKPQFFKKLSDMTGTTIFDYNYDYNKPIFINCDVSKYVWFNINIPLVISSLNYIKLYIIGTPQQNIEVAINNVLKLTIQPSNFKEEYIIFI